MKRTALAVIVLVGLSNAPAQAETVPLIEGLPASYTPGEQFTFAVRVPELIGLLGYRLDLVFTTEANSQLLAFPTFPTDGSYPFVTSQAMFELSGFGSSVVTLSISDPANLAGPPRDPPADVTPGVNDFLATITVAPGGVTGNINITIADSTVFLLQEGGEVRGFGSFDVPQAVPSGNPVPAPPGVVLLSLGALVFGARSRFARRA